MKKARNAGGVALVLLTEPANPTKESGRPDRPHEQDRRALGGFGGGLF